jgi:4-oxalocrotonate tautomerase
MPDPSAILTLNLSGNQSPGIPTTKEKTTMPLIQVKLIEEVFTPAQKKEIVTKLTDAMVAVEGENMRSVTWVIIEDVRSGDWGIGGQAMTTDAVRALAAGKS